MTDPGQTIEPLLDEALAKIAEPRNQRKISLPLPRFTTYLENLGWVQLFNYDMNRYYADADLNAEMQLRQKLFHLDHLDDDTFIGPDLSASVGMYFEYTVVGMEVRHQPDGVPIIQSDHPLTRRPDIRLLRPHDFLTSGAMPRQFRLHEELRHRVKGRAPVSFPTWQRGPLDLAIQLRGYDQFVSDTVERPGFVRDLMKYLVQERIRWWDAYCVHFGVSDKAAGISDDWINIPFISPAIFRDFVLPCYLELEKYHGRIPRVHSCGDKAPVQKYLLLLKTLDSHEVNHWTSLEATLENVPPDKLLAISLLNTEVLLADEAKMERDLRRIIVLCRGRRYVVCAQAVEKVHEDMQEDIRQVQRWIAVVRRVQGSHA